MTGKDMEGGDYSLFQDTILAFSWRDKENHKQSHSG
jgi:hypothetical protein